MYIHIERERERDRERSLWVELCGFWQARYADTLRREWDLVNERGEAFAALATRVDAGTPLP